MSESTVTPVVVLLCRVGSDPELRTVANNLAAFQSLVGGLIEAVSPAEGDWVAYCHEEAKIIGSERNRAAEEICAVNGVQVAPFDYLAGDVFFVGDDGEGGSQDVPHRFRGYVGATPEGW